MDHVPLPLKRIVQSPEGVPSDEEILKRILSEIDNIRKRKRPGKE
jgi:formylmethanofuran dehydrogenase subunit B